MATKLQKARLRSGLKQAAVLHELQRRGDAAGLALASPNSLKALLSAWENGKRPVPQHYRPLLRAIYGMTDTELFGIDAAPAEELNELTRRIATAKAVDGSAIETLARQTDFIRSLDSSVGAPALLDQMNAQLVTLQNVLNHAFLGRVRLPVAAVLADAAALAGWQALDVGAISRAWKHHELARQAARECGDLALLVHAMAQQAVALLDLDEKGLALELIAETKAVARPGIPQRLAAWLWATEAEVRAAVGDADRCRVALDEAERRLPPGQAASDPDMPYIVLNDAHFSRWRGNLLARIGDQGAVTELEKALNQNDPRYIRAEAGMRCDLAYAYAAQGQIDQARVHAGKARRLAIRTGSARQRRRLDRLPMVL